MKFLRLFRPRNLFRLLIITVLTILAFILYKGVIAFNELITIALP